MLKGSLCITSLPLLILLLSSLFRVHHCLSIRKSSLPPPPPPVKNIPLPAKLAGGLFLFATSVRDSDKAFCEETLQATEAQLRADPLISMELGAGLEAGGVFASSSSTVGDVRQIIVDFQINGGNSWAQAKVHSVKVGTQPVRLVSLEVSNMDAAFNGGSAQVPLPEWNEEEEEKDRKVL